MWCSHATASVPSRHLDHFTERAERAVQCAAYIAHDNELVRVKIRVEALAELLLATGHIVTVKYDQVVIGLRAQPTGDTTGRQWLPWLALVQRQGQETTSSWLSHMLPCTISDE